MNKKILLLGDGGHCKSILDSLLELNEYTEVGIIGEKENIGNIVMGVPIVGCDEHLPELLVKGYNYAFVAIGSVGNPCLRIKLFNLLKKIGYNIPVIVDSSAVVSIHSEIRQGVFIGKRCIVNAGALIKEGAIINSGSIIEHDCQIGEFSHVASGAILGGGVIIGRNSHIGANTTIKQQIHVGSCTVIGMGSIVLKNVNDSTMAYGVPCREVKRL